MNSRREVETGLERGTRSSIRRIVTIPACFAAFVTVWGSLPLSLPIAAVLDLWTGKPWTTFRMTLMLAVFLGYEVLGISASFLIWMRSLLPGSNEARFHEDNFRLQCWWAWNLLDAGRRIFGFTFEVAGSESLARGPYFVFIRHASLADTLLPAVLISRRHAIRLRYVLKEELLWDPCLDIVGNRLPNCFVRRGTGAAVEVEAVRSLAENLGPGDGILIYPEGTRFTREKKRRIAERLRASSQEGLAAKAESLQHTLLPLRRGPLALLEDGRTADIVFCAHTGFECAGTLESAWKNGVVGRRVRVRFWRVPRREVPESADQQAEWLYRWWRAIDDWVADSLDS